LTANYDDSHLLQALGLYKPLTCGLSFEALPAPFQHLARQWRDSESRQFWL